MKKLGNYMTVILPFLAALGIQLLCSAGFMFLYVLGKAANMISLGEANYDTIVEMLSESITSDVGVAISAFTALACLIVFAIWYKKICYPVNESLIRKFNLKGIFGIILLGIGLQISLSLFLNIIAAFRPEWFYKYSEIMDQLGMGNSFASVIYIGIIAPFSEEFIFRGVIFKKARQFMPYMAANILQSLMFGIYHMNLVQGIYAFLLGMFLGFICYKIQSVFAAVFLHMVINISGILLGYLNTDSLSSSITYLYIIPVAGIAALTGGMAILLKKEKTVPDSY